MTRGRRLGIDVGAVRVGVALSDPDGVLATPLATVARDVGARHGPRRRSPGWSPSTTSSGSSSACRGPWPGGRARRRRRHGRSPTALAGAPGPAFRVEFSDERLTTVVATRQMRESGRKGRRQRAVVDQVAAVAILQGWLDARR